MVVPSAKKIQAGLGVALFAGEFLSSCGRADGRRADGGVEFAEGLVAVALDDRIGIQQRVPPREQAC
jgi:hypothetical protein